MSASNPVSTRADVYAAIDGERDYCDQMRGNSARVNIGDNRGLGDLILLADQYMGKAKAAFAGPHPQGAVDALHQLRKVANLVVEAMEFHGAYKR